MAGETSRLAAGREPLVLALRGDVPSTWQHASARMDRFLGPLVVPGCPHQMLFIRVRAGDPACHLEGLGGRQHFRG